MKEKITISVPPSKLQQQCTYAKFSEKLTFLHLDVHTFVYVSAYQGIRNITFFAYVLNGCSLIETADPHCVKSVHIRSYSGPYFPAFGLNTDQNTSEHGHFLSIASNVRLNKVSRFI